MGELDPPPPSDANDEEGTAGGSDGAPEGEPPAKENSKARDAEEGGEPVGVRGGMTPRTCWMTRPPRPPMGRWPPPRPRMGRGPSARKAQRPRRASP